MRVINIFDDENSVLFSVKYESHEEHECIRLLNLWGDIEFLDEYFNAPERSTYLQQMNKTPEQMVRETQKYRDGFIDLLNELYANKEPVIKKFKPLSLNEKSIEPKRRKASHGWLRFYGILIEDSILVISGGGIKIVEKMQDCDLLKAELSKIDKCLEFLKTEYLLEAKSYDFIEFP